MLTGLSHSLAVLCPLRVHVSEAGSLLCNGRGGETFKKKVLEEVLMLGETCPREGREYSSHIVWLVLNKRAVTKEKPGGFLPPLWLLFCSMSCPSHNFTTTVMTHVLIRDELTLVSYA